MPQPTIVTQAPRRLIDGSISRRVLLAGSTGLVAATGLAVHIALAQRLACRLQSGRSGS